MQERWNLGTFGVIVTKVLKCKCLPRSYPTYNGKYINCRQAPEPSDIMWENLGVKRTRKAKVRCLNFVITGVLFFVAFAAILGIKFGHEKVTIENVNSASLAGMFLSFFISFMISFINAVMGFLMRRISMGEFYSTYSDYNQAVAWRISLVQFINSSFILIMSNYLVYPDNLNIQMWGDGGLANDAWFILLTNIIVNPISGFCNPFHILRCFKRRSITK